jgi:transposase
MEDDLDPLSWSIETRVYETGKRINRETGKSVFPAEFKRDALNSAERRGKSLAQVARELGISDNTLLGWKQQRRAPGEDAFPGSGQQTPPEEELHRLKRENEIFRQERDSFKKALAIFSRTQS